MFDGESLEEVAVLQLADLLGSNSNQMITSLGGPWGQALFADADEKPNASLFVGRAGSSVGILVDPAGKTIHVGTAQGEWSGVADLVWRISEPDSTFPLDTPVTDPDFVQAVDDAFEAKRASLCICRTCGRITPPEWAFGTATCMACSSKYFGVIY